MVILTLCQTTSFWVILKTSVHQSERKDIDGKMDLQDVWYTICAG
jgi:hypothetical protein